MRGWGMAGAVVSYRPGHLAMLSSAPAGSNVGERQARPERLATGLPIMLRPIALARTRQMAANSCH
jgi:hypothetical protein